MDDNLVIGPFVIQEDHLKKRFTEIRQSMEKAQLNRLENIRKQFPDLEINLKKPIVVTEEDVLKLLIENYDQYNS